MEGGAKIYIFFTRIKNAFLFWQINGRLMVFMQIKDIPSKTSEIITVWATGARFHS